MRGLSKVERTDVYQQLPEELQYGQRRNGSRYRIEPGQLRSFEVGVGGHQPPHHAALPVFLQRFEAFYGNDRILPTNQLLALAVAHHRLAWLHPFADGNGRVARLQSQARLIRYQADGAGLWTLSLSGKGLADFFLFFLREREHIGRILKAALVDGEIDHAAGVSPATGTKLIRRIFFTEGQTRMARD